MAKEKRDRMRAHGKDRSGGARGTIEYRSMSPRGIEILDRSSGVDIHSRRENKGSTQVFRIGGRTAAV